MSPTPDDYDRAHAFLMSRGADRIPHVGGTLLPHLAGTCALLKAWGNPAELCLAGLCHTAYGTDGFPVTLADRTQRTELGEVIGPAAEAIIYFYASCDRKHLYPQIARSQPVQFRDRFSGVVTEPDPALYRSFLELTFANELDIFRRCGVDSPRTAAQWRAILGPCRGLVSEAAYACFVETLGPADRPAPR